MTNLLTFDETMVRLRLDPQNKNDRQKLYRLCFTNKIEYIRHGRRSFFTQEGIENYIKSMTRKARD